MHLDRTVVQGLAAAAATCAEMGQSESQAMEQVAALAAASGSLTPATLRAAAEEIARQPRPPIESVEQTEQGQATREQLGLLSATEQLTAQLRAREWLQSMADALEGPDHGFRRS